MDQHSPSQPEYLVCKVYWRLLRVLILATLCSENFAVCFFPISWPVHDSPKLERALLQRSINSGVHTYVLTVSLIGRCGFAIRENKSIQPVFPLQLSPPDRWTRPHRTFVRSSYPACFIREFCLLTLDFKQHTPMIAASVIFYEHPVFKSNC